MVLSHKALPPSPGDARGAKRQPHGFARLRADPAADDQGNFAPFYGSFPPRAWRRHFTEEGARFRRRVVERIHL